MAEADRNLPRYGHSDAGQIKLALGPGTNPPSLVSPLLSPWGSYCLSRCIPYLPFSRRMGVGADREVGCGHSGLSILAHSW